jgi:hypothetical protein
MTEDGRNQADRLGGRLTPFAMTNVRMKVAPDAGPLPCTVV